MSLTQWSHPQLGLLCRAEYAVQIARLENDGPNSTAGKTTGPGECRACRDTLIFRSVLSIRL